MTTPRNTETLDHSQYRETLLALFLQEKTMSTEQANQLWEIMKNIDPAHAGAILQEISALPETLEAETETRGIINKFVVGFMLERAGAGPALRSERVKHLCAALEEQANNTPEDKWSQFEEKITNMFSEGDPEIAARIWNRFWFDEKNTAQVQRMANLMNNLAHQNPAIEEIISN